VAKPKPTVLEARHVELGARMVPFAGWLMPLQYRRGILAEHRHTRTKVSLFDTCHMGQLMVRGAAAAHDLGRLVTSAVQRLGPGAGKYGLLLNEQGGILDDLVVCRIEDDAFLVVTNASTLARDRQWISSRLSAGTTLEDVSPRMGKVDLQGPAALRTLQPACEADLTGLRYFHCMRTRVCGLDALLSRTGYTGELGYELYVSSERVVQLWSELLALPDVQPAGLGARDTLRLEMGYRLYGQDMDEHRTPFEADLMRHVDLDKDFVGRAALLRQVQAGTAQTFVGFVMQGRRAARTGFAILADGQPAGTVTSGSFAPSLGVPVGMGYVRAGPAWPEGELVSVAVGGQDLPARLARPPFYQHGTARMKISDRS
jgi:aminomethyltransferase